tara:strand:- start:645 stop:1655 length:1011 start_codon:yes stop_codon:yes gene_type:complete
MNSYLPIICGISGTELSNEEIKFFEQYKPWGVILFERNCSDINSIKRLTADLKEINHINLPILIDQEGGRVSRLNFDNIKKFKPSDFFGKLIEQNFDLGLRLLELNSIMMASTLKELGINSNTIPVLDLPANEESGIIGDRAYSTNENIVSAAGKAVIKTLTSNGVVPIMKHIPGHGKAKVDSHLEMPLVDADEILLEKYDFKPFAENAEAQLAMTAHIKFNKIDSDNIATFSKTIINKIIRQHMKFKGLLMTDDLSMKAVDCEPVNAAVKSLDAGCDLVLHCNGNINEMNMIAERIKEEFKPITIPIAIEAIYSQPVSMHMNKAESEFEYLLSQA